MKKYYTLKKNNELKKLQSLIKQHYKTNNKNSLQELNLRHILNNTRSDRAKSKMMDIWSSLQNKLSYEIYALYNLSIKKKGSLPKGYSFILKLAPDVTKDMLVDIQKQFGLKLEVFDIDI
ncbi:hypothetical protein [Francisella sp. SYW-9]|uniref:hypothetical protein n=1 Tax=Francisella sp. SYW-9 TaxID=2610888 RepID=UPI00123DE89A|nr:hypothetical protein [Francisella sp. SYW-9]